MVSLEEQNRELKKQLKVKNPTIDHPVKLG